MSDMQLIECTKCHHHYFKTHECTIEGPRYYKPRRPNRVSMIDGVLQAMVTAGVIKVREDQYWLNDDNHL